MKKNSFSNVVKTSLLFVGISLLLWNCRKQEFHEGVAFENFSSAYKQRTISLSELADVKKYIDEINPSNEVGKTSEIEGAIFDQDNVIEVIDTIQNTNYSLRFTYPDTPSGEFYNLIIGRTPEGELTTPFVLKYVCDEDFVDNYIANDFDIHYFKGVIKLHTYTDFFSLGAFSKTTDCPPEHDDVGDPVECEEQPLDGSSMTGGGSNNGDNNGNSYSGNNSGISFGGAGSGCSFWVTDNGPCAEGGTEIHPPSACGAGTGVQHVLIIECATESKTTTTNDCPSCATTNPVGGIGMNQPSIERMRVDLIRRLQMNDSNQINWVNDDMNNQNVIDIISFLNLHKPLDGNDDTPYAINFAQSAVEALVNNGEVDFKELVIIIDTPDDNYDYQGDKQHIPNPLTLSNGENIIVTFETYTSDDKSSNQEVAIELINAMRFALEQANNNLSSDNKITSINVYATTNGHGEPGPNNHSNHLKATAVDINSINGDRMAVTGLTDKIKELQIAFDNFQYIRENFGPYFKHKFTRENPIGSQWNYNYPVSGHKDHIHISIRE